MTPGLWVLAGVLVAVPLFVFAANIMNAGTVSERIFDFCRILAGACAVAWRRWTFW